MPRRHRLSGRESGRAGTKAEKSTKQSNPWLSRSLKDEWLRRIQIPLRRDAMQRELECYKRWFEEHRPHQSLGGKTPREFYDGCEQSTPADAKRPLKLVVRFHEGRRALPIVELKNAA